MSGLITGIAGLAITAGTTAASFAQANKQKKLQKKAEAAAEKSMESARKALGVNYFEELAVQKEKFELQREATLTAQKDMMSGLQDAGARALAGGVGRLGLAGQKAQQETRTAMGEEMSDLQKMTAQEDSRLRDVGVQLDLAEVQGSQEAAARADEQRAQAIKEGITGATSTLQQGLSMVPLYQQNLGAQKQALGGVIGNKALGDAAMGDVGGGRFAGQTVGLLDYQGMSNADFRNFKRNLTPQQRSGLFNNSAFANAYQNADTSYMNPFQLR